LFAVCTFSPNGAFAQKSPPEMIARRRKNKQKSRLVSSPLHATVLCSCLVRRTPTKISLFVPDRMEEVRSNPNQYRQLTGVRERSSTAATKNSGLSTPTVQPPVTEQCLHSAPYYYQPGGVSSPTVHFKFNACTSHFQYSSIKIITHR
jgi:hypothetical protein